MAPVDDAPTAELGYAAGIAPTFYTGAGAGFFVDGTEDTAELRFPGNVTVYDRMRRSDGQVASILRAFVLPMMATGRRLVGDDVRPEVLAMLEAELGLNVDASRARRRRQGIVFGEHLRHALLMLPLGFMPFEQVYDVGPAAPELVAAHPETKGRLYAHLRKLAPRMPRTLLEVRVARDGGLAGIVQTPPPGMSDPRGVFIPTDRLVMYVNDREGADWTGTSVLRAAYKHWLIKDALIRLGPQIVERNGMGIPVVTVAQGGDRAKALALAKSIRAGAEAGAVVDEGMSLNLVGVTGSLKDELPLVKYHDEAASRSLLAMFLDLGHDNGARSLGDTFVDYFLLASNSVLDNVAETFTEHVIRDLVELNYGPDEPYPSLKFDALSADSRPTTAALKELADAGLITADRELEADVRRRYGLPAKPEPTGGQAVEDAAGSPVADVGIPALIDAGVISPDEGRRMLRLTGPAPGQPAPAADPTPADVVQLPAAMASNLSANRQGIRSYLALDGLVHVAHDGPVTHTPYGAVPREQFTGDPLVDRLAAVTAQLTALRAGHGQA